ncbi:MAG: hypothetical protein QM346_12280 [Chloroflexota bacterium]|nr:hypothetical protein [Chloroflexota bacterium]
MPRPTRLANKTIWALEDIIARSRIARARWDAAMRHAERSLDPAMMLLLARLRDDLAEIERLAKDARHGEYSESSPS